MIKQNICLLGDCLELTKDIPEKTVDMILTDLPYGVTDRNEWDLIIDQKKLWEEWNRVKKETTPIILTAIQPFTSFLISTNPKFFKYCLYWEKERGTGFQNVKHQPLRTIEEICIFYNKIASYNPQMKKLDKPYKHTLPIKNSSIYGFRLKSLKTNERIYRQYTHSYPTNLIKFARENNRKNLHPTQKPMALFEYLIKTYSNEGDLVLDCCAGSGTTAIACLNTNRKYICIEKEKKYFDIMKNRIMKHIGEITN